MGPQPDNPESFGQFLRRERELREIKLEEIASYTRIQLRSLQAIEQDDFASLPPLAFIRAFVRCYADFIGLSIPDVMLRFDGFVQTRYPELTGEVPMIKSQREPSQRYLIVLLALVVGALVAISWWMSRAPVKVPQSSTGTSGSAPILGATSGNLPPTSDVLMLPGVTARPAIPTASPGTTAARETLFPLPGETLLPSPELGLTAGLPAAADNEARVEVSMIPGSTAASTQGPPASANIRPGIKQHAVLTLKGDCWIGYTLDGEKKGELNLKQGQAARFEAREGIRLIIGNPNAISAFNHNGATVDFKPLCSPQHISLPAGPEDKSCYPRTLPGVRRAPVAPSPARPAPSPSRPPAGARNPE